MKQAKRIIAMVLCLLALLALPAGAVMEKGEPNITAQTTMKEVRNNPGIKNSGFYTYSQDKDCPPGQALWEMTTVEGYTNEYVAEGCAKGLNLVIENYNNGVQVTHSFYTDAEKAADRTKNNTGLFYFPAKAENAKFALILAGSGANESAELNISGTGTLTATAEGDALYSERDMTISGTGAVNATGDASGIYTQGDLSINSCHR